MAMIHHPATGFPVGDPERTPLDPRALPSTAELEAALGSLMLSASGWRKVFAAPDPAAPRAPWSRTAPPPGGADEDSLGSRVSPADLVLAGLMGLVFGERLVEASGLRRPALLLGIDSRPTGPALADALCRVFLGMGLRPRYLFIVAAPEIMASTRTRMDLESGHPDRVEGFCYVSASHNPPGHNGVKFGRGGGVLPSAEIAPMIDRLRSLAAAPDAAARVLALMEEADPAELARAYSGCQAAKRRSVSDYTLFSRRVVTGIEDPAAQEELLAGMAEEAGRRPTGVVAELNGSARALSIDADFLGGLGVASMAINAVPRAFSHRIVPEGASLDEARDALASAGGKDASWVAGYVPDCDGDRGNLVWRDAATGIARALDAQEVFALCCVSELATLTRRGTLRHDEGGNALDRVAIAVNDATSMRVNAIARAFDVDVYRAETGEANVVGLAASLRARGYLVRILGEGSNGGNITHPSEVRDPLATLGALLKLLLLRDGNGGEGLWRSYMRLSGRLSDYAPDFGLAEVLASLPAFSTTSVFEDRAALRIASTDQVALKARYARVFRRGWDARSEELAKRLGVAAWRAFASNGGGEREVGEDFAASGRGGLRLALEDGAGRPRAFLWMRGSGTEPLFRIMADVDGEGLSDRGAAMEEYLLDWQRAMVLEADAAAGPESGAGRAP